MPASHPAGVALLVTSVPGQPTVEEYRRGAAIGERPRKDFVELAARLDADVLDGHRLYAAGVPLARRLARHAGMPAGQVIDAFLRRRQYAHIVAWSDRLGLPLALLLRLACDPRDLVLISVWMTRGTKGFLARHGAGTRPRAIVHYGSAQLEAARDRLGIPAGKLHLALQPVDERFWSPRLAAPAADDGVPTICSAGWEARDYATLVEATSGLGVRVELATGSIALSVDKGASPRSARFRRMAAAGLPSHVGTGSYSPPALRALYARSRFVVVPVEDVEYDAGVTCITEAMAMGKAVIVTRTRGQRDLVEHGVNGLYVPPGDAATLAAAIRRLLAHPEEAERMGRAGRSFVERSLTLDRYTARLAAIVAGDALPATAPPAGSDMAKAM